MRFAAPIRSDSHRKRKLEHNTVTEKAISKAREFFGFSLFGNSILLFKKERREIGHCAFNNFHLLW